MTVYDDLVALVATLPGPGQIVPNVTAGHVTHTETYQQSFDLLARMARPVFKPEDYQADDATDWDQAFADVLAAADDDGGGVVWLKPGKTYNVTLDGYVHLNGLTNITLESFGATIQMDEHVGGPHVDALFIQDCDGVTISGITVCLEAAPTETNGSYGIHVVDSTRVRLLNCEVHTTPAAGIVVTDSTWITIAACMVHDTQADGIRVGGASSEVAVTGNVIWSTGDDGIAVVSPLTAGVRTRNVAVSGNSVEDCVGGRGIAVVGGDNVTVTGNTVRNVDSSGIIIQHDGSFETYGTRNCVVSGNTVENANRLHGAFGGIHIAGGGTSVDLQIRNIAIIGNTITNCYGAGIRGSGASAACIQDLMVGSNTIVNITSGQAIRMTGVENPIIRGNHGYGIDGGGVLVANTCTGVIVVQDNTLLDLNRLEAGSIYGVAVASGTTATVIAILDNIITGSDLAGDISSPSANTTIRRFDD